MKNKSRTERYIFRIYRVPKSIVLKFKEEFIKLDYNDVDLGKVPIRKIPNRYTITIVLNKKQKYKRFIPNILNFIKRYKILEISYGIWVSLSTNRDMDGLTVPKHVTEFYKKVGGALDFSFICLADEPN